MGPRPIRPNVREPRSGAARWLAGPAASHGEDQSLRPGPEDVDHRAGARAGRCRHSRAPAGPPRRRPPGARPSAPNAAHCAGVCGNGRREYAIQKGAVSDPERQARLSAFLFWTSWAAVTNRPGDTVTYTSNWPHEKLVGNRPTSDAIV